MKGFYASGHISWENFFAPSEKTPEIQKKRNIAAWIIFGSLVTIFSMFLVFAMLDMIWAMMFMLVLMIYLISLITVNFLRIKVFRRRRA
ncbi:MAG: hypothetical protein K9W44_00260 [Candidatus Lokiarchaeota archaeon]|nr:hypothetical protein [Candidatus Harpocratesius repetitus]